jgi:2-polyprenyl-6-methoxyphenol hydroxylase-like FAD-dependent oxidoreductase
MIILFKHYKNNANSKKIAIVGSGLGSLLAIYLKAGHTVHLYDRSPDIRQIQFSGRSINLAMSNRVWKARWCWDIGFSSRNRNTHGQTRYSLGRQA